MNIKSEHRENLALMLVRLALTLPEQIEECQKELFFVFLRYFLPQVLTYYSWFYFMR